MHFSFLAVNENANENEIPFSAEKHNIFGPTQKRFLELKRKIKRKWKFIFGQKRKKKRKWPKRKRISVGLNGLTWLTLTPSDFTTDLRQWPNQQCQSTDGEKYHIHGLAYLKLTFDLSAFYLTIKSFWLPWGGLPSLSSARWHLAYPIFVTRTRWRKSQVWGMDSRQVARQQCTVVQVSFRCLLREFTEGEFLCGEVSYFEGDTK